MILTAGREIEKIKKEYKNKVVNYICAIFPLATQTFNEGCEKKMNDYPQLAPMEGLCYKPKYRANIIHHFIFVFFLYFFYHSSCRKDQFTVLEKKGLPL